MTDTSDDDDDFTNCSGFAPCSSSTICGGDLSYIGKNIRMKFKMQKTGKMEWFNGQIISFDPLSKKYGVFFPIRPANNLY